MARKTYKTTDETRQVLTGFEAEIAREMECDPSYVYKIKNGAEPDRYPQFRGMFRAAAYAGAPVRIWLNDLIAIDLKSKRAAGSAAEVSLGLIEKINADAASVGEILKSTEDGNIDKAECHRILAELEKVRAVNAKIERAIHNRLGDLTDGEKK